MKIKQPFFASGFSFLIMEMGVAQGESVATLPTSQHFQSGELPQNKWIPLPPPLYSY